MKISKTPSWLALLFIVLVFGGSFVWWFRTRPSFLIYQAHSQIGKENQSAVVARYESLLANKDLKKEEEIRLRSALGEFYIGASDTFGTVVLRGQKDPYQIEHPFIDKAKREFDRILELDPSNARAHYLLGRLLLLKKLETFAIEEFKISLRYDPKLVDSLFYLSLIHLEREKPEQAKAFATEALAINGQHDRVRWSLIQAQVQLGEGHQALRQFRQLSLGFRRSPQIRSSFAYLLAEQNHWAEALREMEQAMASDPEHHWVRINQARIFMLQDDYQSALGELMHVQKTYKTSPWPVFWLSYVNAALGDCYKSNLTSGKLIQGLPRWPSSHLSQAWTHLCTGQDRQAQGELEEALRLAPEFLAARRLLASVLLDRGDDPALGELIRPWLDEKRNQSEAYTLLAQRFYEQEQWGMTKEMAESAIQADLQNEWAYVWLGLARLTTKDKKGARRSFENALNLNAHDLELKAYGIYFETLQDRLTPGVPSLSALLNQNPRSSVIWRLKAQMELDQGQNAEALQFVKQALLLTPYSLNGLLLQAEAEMRLGDRQSASRSLKKASKFNAIDPRVIQWKKKINS